MSITGANAVIMLSINGLFPVPQQLQGFAADDVFSTDQLESSEVSMGVDGVMSAGFVFVPVRQQFQLQADSSSIAIFEAWYAAQQQLRDVYYANGVVLLTAVGRKYTMTKGALSGYKPISDVKKLIQPTGFAITWESVLPSVA